MVPATIQISFKVILTDAIKMIITIFVLSSKYTVPILISIFLVTSFGSSLALTRKFHIPFHIRGSETTTYIGSTKTASSPTNETFRVSFTPYTAGNINVVVVLARSC